MGTDNSLPLPLAYPEKAARQILEIAQAVEPVQNGRIYIEKVNGPFLFGDKGTPAEYKAVLYLAIERGWLVMHESGAEFVQFITRARRFTLADFQSSPP